MIAIMSDLIEHFLSLKGSRFRADAAAALFRRNDPIRFMHLIEGGVAHLVRYNENGVAMVMQRALPGMILAESSLFSDRYHCDGLALSELTGYRVRASTLRQAMRDDAEIAVAVSSYLAREVHRMRVRTEILSQKTVRARLDFWLAVNGELPARGGWKAVADDIGVAPEALYREIAGRGQAVSGAKARR